MQIIEEQENFFEMVSKVTPLNLTNMTTKHELNKKYTNNMLIWIGKVHEASTLHKELQKAKEC